MALICVWPLNWRTKWSITVELRNTVSPAAKPGSYALAGAMEDVEVILKSHEVSGDRRRSKPRGGHAPPLLFGGEALDERVVAVGQKQRGRVLVDRQSVGLASIEKRSLDAPVAHVPGIDKWRGIGVRICSTPPFPPRPGSRQECPRATPSARDRARRQPHAVSSPPARARVERRGPPRATRRPRRGPAPGRGRHWAAR